MLTFLTLMLTGSKAAGAGGGRSERRKKCTHALDASVRKKSRVVEGQLAPPHRPTRMAVLAEPLRQWRGEAILHAGGAAKRTHDRCGLGEPIGRGAPCVVGPLR